MLVLALVLVLPLAMAACPSCPAAPAASEQVCGSDLRTYPSRCDLDCAAVTAPGLSVTHTGPCIPLQVQGVLNASLQTNETGTTAGTPTQLLATAESHGVLNGSLQTTSHLLGSTPTQQLAKAESCENSWRCNRWSFSKCGLYDDWDSDCMTMARQNCQCFCLGSAWQSCGDLYLTSPPPPGLSDMVVWAQCHDGKGCEAKNTACLASCSTGDRDCSAQCEVDYRTCSCDCMLQANIPPAERNCSRSEGATGDWNWKKYTACEEQSSECGRDGAKATSDIRRENCTCGCMGLPGGDLEASYDLVEKCLEQQDCSGQLKRCEDGCAPWDWGCRDSCRLGQLRCRCECNHRSAPSSSSSG